MSPTVQPHTCDCDCGEFTTPHVRTGAPQRFIKGHQNRKPLWFIVQDCGFETPCWVWQGSIEDTGYGTFTRGGIKYAAHRQSFRTLNGPIPPGHMVCHRCDNPPCIRPDHLFAGPAIANVRDMIRKGRNARGDKPWRHAPRPQCRGQRHKLARLDEQSVRAIRRRYAEGGISERHLAGEYRVSRGAIRRVIKHTSWGWLDD